MKSSNAYMGEEKLGKLFRKLSLPSILTLLVSALYNIVDHIFIGYSSVGMYGHIATTVVFPITVIAEAFAFMFGDGTAVFFSVREDEFRGDTPEARKNSKLSRAVAGTMLFTVIASLFIIAVAFPLKEPILRLLGASDNTISYALEYFTIIVAFFPVFMLMNMLNAVIRADGSSKYAMAASLSGAVINIILDPVFIYTLDWGLTGAAWATVIGQAVSLILCIGYLFRSKEFRLSLKAFLPDFDVIRRCARFGFSSFINQFTIVIMSVSLNILLSIYGAKSVYGQDIPIAVIGIETKIFAVVLNIFSGLAIGGQPILEFNHGAQKFDRVRKCYKLILLWTVIVGAVATILIEAIPQYIIGIFGTSSGSPDYDESLYLQFGAYTLRIFLALGIFNGLAKVSGGVFQSLGRPGDALAVSVVHDIIVFIPLAILIPYISEMITSGSGVVALLFSGPATDLVGFVLAVLLTVAVFRDLRKEEAKYNANRELARRFKGQAPEDKNDENGNIVR